MHFEDHIKHCQDILENSKAYPILRTQKWNEGYKVKTIEDLPQLLKEGKR